MAGRTPRAPLYEQRIRETVGWLLREMRAAAAPDGSRAFASALDADSEGEEGKFYVWSEAEIDARCWAPTPALFKQHYDVTPGGNWEGHTILNRSANPDLGDAATEEKLAAGRAHAAEAARQAHPSGLGRQGAGRLERADDRGAGEGRRCLRRAWLAEAARAAFAFVRTQMTVDGRLRHSWRDRQGAPSRDVSTTTRNMARAALILGELDQRQGLCRPGGELGRRARPPLLGQRRRRLFLHRRRYRRT